MAREAAVLRKLDAQLLRIVDDEKFAQDQEFPIYVIPEEGQLESAAAAVKAVGGRIRHTLVRLHCIAAWLPFAAIERLASEPVVHALEVAQPVEVA